MRSLCLRKRSVDVLLDVIRKSSGANDKYWCHLNALELTLLLSTVSGSSKIQPFWQTGLILQIFLSPSVTMSQ